MSELQQQSDNRVRYVCAHTFRINETVIIKLGDVVEYDETYLYRKNQKPIEAPNLKQVLNLGWLVLPDAVGQAAQANHAPIMVTPTVTGNVAPGASGKIKQPMKFAHVQDEQRYSLDRTASIKSVRPSTQRPLTASSSGGAGPGERGQVDTDDIPLKVPARSTVSLFTDAGALTAELGSVTIDPRKGVSVEELLDNLSPEERIRREYELEKQQIKVRARANTPEEREAQTIREETVKLHAKMLAKLASLQDGQQQPQPAVFSEVEGISFATTGIPSAAVAAVAQQQPVSERPKAVPVEPKSRKAVDPGVKSLIAKSVLPTFPFEQYNFADTDRKKLARIDLDFEDKFDILRAIYAAEDDVIREHIADNYPAALR